jgi:hypothetical protein
MPGIRYALLRLSSHGEHNADALEQFDISQLQQAKLNNSKNAVPNLAWVRLPVHLVGWLPSVSGVQLVPAWANPLTCAAESNSLSVQSRQITSVADFGGRTFFT